MALTNSTKLYQLRERMIDECFQALLGTPALDKEGHVIMVDGKPLMIRPTASTLNVIRQTLKDNGIDHEPITAEAPNRLKELPFVEEGDLLPEPPERKSLPNWT